MIDQKIKSRRKVWTEFGDVASLEYVEALEKEVEELKDIILKSMKKKVHVHLHEDDGLGVVHF